MRAGSICVELGSDYDSEAHLLSGCGEITEPIWFLFPDL